MPTLLLLLTSVNAVAQTQPFVDPCDEIDHPVSINASQVHLRSAPSLDADIVAAVPWGTCATFHHADETWGAVTVGGVRGYIDGRFLTPDTLDRTPLPDSVRIDGLCL